MAEGTLTPASERHLDFLRTDFQAVKTEISRRSDLQKFAIAAYLASIGALVSILVTGTHPYLLIVGLSTASLATLLFWCREAIEIGRLGRLIRDRIATQAGQILGVPPENVVPSETPSSDPTEGARAHSYHRVFMWLVFVILPATIAAYVLAMRVHQLHELLMVTTIVPYLAFLSLGCFVGCAWLTWRHTR